MHAGNSGSLMAYTTFFARNLTEIFAYKIGVILSDRAVY